MRLNRAGSKLPSLVPTCLLLLAAGLAVACSDPGSRGKAGATSGGGDGAADTGEVVQAAVASVTVDAPGFMLTGRGDSHSVVATAWDQHGEPMDGVSFEWSSSRPDLVSVDSLGMVTAAASVGSAVISVQADGVPGPSFLVVVADVADGVTLVPDRALAEAPEPVDPDALYGVGARLSVRLIGTSLASGDRILSEEQGPLAGQVVTAEDIDGGQLVVYEIRPFDELFDQLQIQAELELGRVQPIDTGRPSPWDETWISSDGTLVLTPRTDGEAVPPSPSSPGGPPPPGYGGSFADVCSWEFDLAEPVEVAEPVASLKPKGDLTVDFDLDASRHILRYDGTVDFEMKVGMSTQAAVVGCGQCEVDVGKAWPVVPMPLGAVVGALVQPSVGVALNGRLDFQQFGVDAGVANQNRFDVGFECLGEADCVLHDDVEFGDLQFPMSITQRGDFVDDFRLQADVQGYANLSFKGGITVMDFLFDVPPENDFAFEFLATKFGVKQSFDWMPMAGQASDPGYQSAYALEAVAEVMFLPELFEEYELPIADGSRYREVLGATCGDPDDVGTGDPLSLLQLLGKLVPRGVTVSAPLAQSPSGTVEVGAGAWTEGAVIPVEFKLTAGETYLGIDNVDGMNIYRVTRRADGDVESLDLVAALSPPAPGQPWQWLWEVSAEDIVDPPELVVGVETMLPLFELELGASSSFRGDSGATRLDGDIYTGDASLIIAGTEGDQVGLDVALIPALDGPGRGGFALPSPSQNAVFVAGAEDLDTSVGMVDLTRFDGDGDDLVTLAAGVGDATGSSYGDLAVTSLAWDSKVWIVDGSTLLGGGGVSLDEAAATVLLGRSGSTIGTAVSPAGDWDGDLLSDYIVSAEPGVARLIYGSAPGTIRFIDEVPGVVVSVTPWTDDRDVTAVAGDFDMNGDSLPDLAVADSTSSATGVAFHGWVSVVEGDGGTSEVVADPQFSIRGEEGDELGHTLVGLRDFDLDGYGDLAVGTRKVAGAGSGPGVVSIWYGGTSLPSTSGDSSLSVSSAPLTLLASDLDDGAAWSMARARTTGTTDDLIVGAWAYDRGSVGGEGVTYLVRAADLPSTGTAPLGDYDLQANATARFYGSRDLEYLGWSVAGGADLDSDGLEDILVGAPGWSSESGDVTTMEGRALLYLSHE